MYGLIFSDPFFNRAGNKLLDLLRRSHRGHEQEATGHPDRNIRIFRCAWNGSQTSPQTRTPARKEPKKTWGVLNEEPREVMCFLDPILVGFCVPWAHLPKE